MPLTPAEAAGKKHKSSNPEFKEACKSIDRMLVDRDWPAYWNCSDISKETTEQIQEAYGSKGWSVEYVYDMRDGNCLKFDKR